MNFRYGASPSLDIVLKPSLIKKKNLTTSSLHDSLVGEEPLHGLNQSMHQVSELKNFADTDSIKKIEVQYPDV